ncbi:predicted protein [Histoplasma capsulatum H143]|uniref:Uncharacterized protein n=1 Tax=Ajellomyces capsulatus (strain H143) TaxID=544712 RepID=C6H403_AJECH|nr:predicted protein [Histoplasma capsulatum H143]
MTDRNGLDLIDPLVYWKWRAGGQYADPNPRTICCYFGEFVKFQDSGISVLDSNLDGSRHCSILTRCSPSHGLPQHGETPLRNADLNPSTNFLFEAEWRFDPLAQIIQAPRYSSGPELFPLPSAMIRPHKERYLHESSHLKVTQRGGSLLLDGLSIMQISVAARNDRFRF